MKLQYDIEAKRQLREIFDYSKERFGLHTAYKFRDAIRQKINTLKQHPFIGSIEWQLTTSEYEYRYLLLKPYKIIYSIKDDVIRITTVH